MEKNPRARGRTAPAATPAVADAALTGPVAAPGDAESHETAVIHVDTPQGPGVLIPYSRITVHEQLSPGWWGLVEYPDGRRRIWRLDQIEVKP